MSSGGLASWQDWSRGLEAFDLSSVPESDLNKRDVIGKIVTGVHSGIRFKHNFLRCAFRDAKLDDLDWTRVDYKDTVFINTAINDSRLGGGSAVSCTYSHCTFIRCSFEDAAIHDCHYEDSVFVECDFRNSMLRNSQIVECQFERCTTSNKLFEGCRLFDNRFLATMLDFRAIVDNFGLDCRQLPFEGVREDRSHPSDTPMPIDTRVSDSEWVSGLSSFEAIKLQFYLAGGELVGGDVVDTAFRPDEWMSLVRAPVNLMRLLLDFSEFIFHMFSADKIPSIFVLKLAVLAEAVWRGFANHPAHAQIGQVGAGIYFQCLRFLEDLDAVVAKQLGEFRQQRLVLRSYDDADDAAIAELRNLLRKEFPGAMIEARPRNSPIDLFLFNLSPESVALLLVLFFSTKTRIQLSRLNGPSGGEILAKDLAPIVSLSIGGAANEALRSALSLTGRLPGTMVLRLDVDYSSALVEKIKKLVRSLTS